MGKGDKKTKRGKIIKGSYGVRRPKKKNGGFVQKEKPIAKKAEVAKTEEKIEDIPKKKPAAKKTTITKKAETVNQYFFIKFFIMLIF